MHSIEMPAARRSCPGKSDYLAGKQIEPTGVTGQEPLVELIEQTMLAYNGGRLREACELVVKQMLEANVTVGLSLAGALTPAGLGRSCVVPLIKAGFADWIVATGANLYHDLHFAFDCLLHRGMPHLDDVGLRARSWIHARGQRVVSGNSVVTRTRQGRTSTGGRTAGEASPNPKEGTRWGLIFRAASNGGKMGKLE